MFTDKIYSSWMKENQLAKYRELRGFLPDLSGRVLDIGIGPGWFEEFLGIKAVGLDVDKNSTAEVLASGDSIPFRAGIFDLVICLDTIHLLDGKDIKRVIKPRGLLLVSHFFNKGNEKEVEETLLNMFNEFKLLKRRVIGEKEKDLVMLLKKGN